MFTLDDRLNACAELVREGARLADIGTDHAYLPVWLLHYGKIQSAIASDINSAPLESGRSTAEKYGIEGIEFRLGSGLEPLKPEDGVTDIVIAGLGGELIARILADSPLSKNSGLSFILQPMTRSDELILFLCREGFEIDRQICVSAHKKSYTVLRTRFTGKCREPDELYPYIGELDLNEPESRKFLQRHLNNLRNKSHKSEEYLSLYEKLEKKLNED